MANTTPDFDTIWAANSPIGLYPLTTKEILQGWNFVGATPPPRSAFDAWMNRADLKMQWMYNNMFSEDALAGFLYWRLPNTAYFVGEKVALQKEFDIYLECTTAGESSADPMLTLPEGKKVGDALQDGTIQWVVRQNASTAYVTESIGSHNTNENAHPNLTRVKSMNAKDGVLTVTTVNDSSTNEEEIPLGLNILQRKKKYDVGDIAYSASLPSWAYLECTTAGTTGETEPDFSGVTTGRGVITDGTAEFTVRDIREIETNSKNISSLQSSVSLLDTKKIEVTNFNSDPNYYGFIKFSNGFQETWGVITQPANTRGADIHLTHGYSTPIIVASEVGYITSGGRVYISANQIDAYTFRVFALDVNVDQPPKVPISINFHIKGFAV